MATHYSFPHSETPTSKAGRGKETRVKIQPAEHYHPNSSIMTEEVEQDNQVLKKIRPPGPVSDAEAAKVTETLIEYFKAGKMNNEVKIILVLGHTGAGKSSLIKLLTGIDIPLGHDLRQGSIQPNLLLTEFGGQPYIYIDTPGFGHREASYESVRKSIQNIVGYFTRSIGGIHGILYVQSIQSNRNDVGMEDGLVFLDELAKFQVRSNITFITTHWDLIVPKAMANCENRERILKEEKWIKFAVDGPDSLKYYRHGISADQDTEEEKAIGRQGLLDSVFRYYETTSPERLVMPFAQWTFPEQAAEVAGWTLYVGLSAGAVALGGLFTAGFAAAVAAGEVTVGFGIGLGAFVIRLIL